MATSVLVFAIVLLIASALYYRRERRRLEQLLYNGDLNIYVYMDPEAGLAPYLDVYTEEVLERKMNAQWN